MAENPAIKARQAKDKKYILVRYGRMNTLGLFEHHESQIPNVPTRVVVKTDKGLELGYLVGPGCIYRSGKLRLSPDQIKEYFEDSDIDLPCEKSGKLVRYATSADISEERHLRKIAEEEIQCCRQFVKQMNLPMKIVDAEHIFGGERIIFYFMSDTRVDFRQLVKNLAQEYQTRIEMRQIGSRDEAKILGDVESCGQQCCCIRFLKALKPVNMRMAKMQKATLDPSKISGYCGRLKCCLRYEDETYTELKKHLPKKNTLVKTKYGMGKVVETQILTQLAAVQLDNGTKVVVKIEELEILGSQDFAEQEQSDAEQEQPDTEQEQQNDNQHS